MLLSGFQVTPRSHLEAAFHLAARRCHRLVQCHVEILQDENPSLGSGFRSPPRILLLTSSTPNRSVASFSSIPGRCRGWIHRGLISHGRRLSGKRELTGCNVIMQILISQSGGLPNTLTKKLAVYLLVRAPMSTCRKRLPTDVRALLRCGAEMSRRCRQLCAPIRIIIKASRTSTDPSACPGLSRV